MSAKLFSFVCVFLIVVILVTASDLKDDHAKEEPKTSRRHPKIKPILKEGEYIKPTDIENDLETIARTIIVEDEIKDPVNRNIPESTEQPKIEDDILRTGSADVTDTDIHITNQNRDGDLDILDSETSKADTDSEDDFSEILIYSPDTDKLNEDVAIDLKARTGQIPTGRSGFVESEDDYDSYGEPPSRGRLNTAFVLEDRVSGKHHEYRPEYLKPFHKLHGVYNKDAMSLSFDPNNEIPRPRVIFNDRPHSALRLPQILFNKINSREIMYPKPSSREIVWGQNNSPSHVINNGLPVYGNMPYSSSELCYTCRTNKNPSHDSFGKSGEQSFLTTNGRSLEVDPSGANSYPYVARGDVRPSISHLRELQSEEHTAASYEHNSQSRSHNHNFDPFVSFGIQRSFPLLMNRKIGIGGYPIIAG